MVGMLKLIAIPYDQLQNTLQMTVCSLGSPPSFRDTKVNTLKWHYNKRGETLKGLGAKKGEPRGVYMMLRTGI